MAQSTTANSLIPFNKNFYEVVETYELQAAIAVGYFDQKIGNGQKAKAACFSLTVASGTQFCNDIQKEVAAEGGTYIRQYAITPAAVDATPEVTQIQASNPNVIFLHGSPNTAITLFKAMDKLGMKTPVVGIYATVAENVFLTAPRSVTQGFAGIHSYTPAYISTPGNDEMNAASVKYGVDATLAKNLNFVNGWVTGKVFVAGARAGAKASGKVDHNSLRKGLDSLSNFDTGGQSCNFTYSGTDHQGLKTARAYTFDFTKSQLVPAGSYADYAKYFKG
jgi:branched-chain amino acid transport system substrate-binding protein